MLSPLSTQRDLMLSGETIDQSSKYNRKVPLRQFSQNFIAIKKKLKNKRKTTFHTSPKISPVQEKHFRKGLFKKLARKLIIILSFFDSLKQYSKEQLHQRIEYFKLQRKTIFPLFPDDYWMVKWQYFIKILLFLYIILFPLTLAYDLNLSILILIFQLFFCVDFLLTLVTGYVNEDYDLITDYLKIAQNYFKSWMIIDIISLIPFYLIYNQLKLINLLRLIKYFFKNPIKNYKGQRLYDQIQIDSLNFDNSYHITDGWIFFFYVLLNAFLLIHIFACLFDYIQIENNYINSIYWASQTLFTDGYGDQQADNTLSSIWIIIAIGYYSIKIRDFAQLIHRLDNKTDDIFFKLEKLTYFCYIPEDFKEKIKGFINTNQQNNIFWNISIKEMFNEYPKQIQNYFILSAQLEIFQNIPLFLQDINYTSHLIQFCRYNIYQQGDIIYRNGQISDEVYYLISGEVRIQSTHQFELINILEGTLFGEFEPLNDFNRLTFAIAYRRSLVMIINYKSFLFCLQSQQLRFEIQQLQARRKQLIIQQLKSEQVEMKKLKRKNVIIFEEGETQIIQKEEQFQSSEQFNQYLLRKLLSQKFNKRAQLKQIFQQCVQKVLDLSRQINNTSPEDWKDLNEYELIKKTLPYKIFYNRNNEYQNTKKSTGIFNSKLKYSNYIQTRKQEIQIQKKIIMHSRLRNERMRSIQQILNNCSTNKIQILESKYRVIQNYQKYDQKIDFNIDEFYKIDLQLSQISEKWLEGSLEKFEIYKQLFHQ